MKNIFSSSFIAVIVLFSGFKTLAQTDEVKLIQSMYGMEKRELINRTMNLTAEQSVGFWTVYDKYENERKKLGAERIQIINEYVSAYQSLTDDQADKLAKRVLDNNKDYDKLQMEYYKKMKRQVGPIKAATFMQVENYLLNAITLEIQENMPFVGDLQQNVKK